MPETISSSYSYDASALAWHGDRQSYLALEPETRRLLDGIQAYLEDALASDPDLHDSCHYAPDCEAEHENRELREAIGEHVQISAEDDAESIGNAIELELKTARAEGEKDATIPSRASTAERKAMRLVLERRLEIVRIDPATGVIHARCRGDSSTYDLGYDPRPEHRRWRCTCPELKGDCSHLKALQLVTTIRNQRGRMPDITVKISNDRLAELEQGYPADKVKLNVQEDGSYRLTTTRPEGDRRYAIQYLQPETGTLTYIETVAAALVQDSMRRAQRSDTKPGGAVVVAYPQSEDA